MKKSFSLLLLVALLISACKKDRSGDDAPNDAVQSFETSDLSIPDGFSFQTTERVSLNLDIEAAPLPGKYLLQVFDQKPSVISKPIYEVFISEQSAFSQAIEIPSSTQNIYLVLQSPDRSSFLTILPKSSSITHTFYRRKFKVEPESNGPPCSSGCDVVRGHFGNWVANNNFEEVSHNGNGHGNGNAYAYGHNHHNEHDHDRVYCVTGTYNGSGSISITEGAIVRLCGTGSIPTLSIHDGVLKILSGANVTINNLNIDNVAGNELIVYQGGSLTITNWFTPHSTVNNYGTINSAALHLLPGKTLNNYGFLHLNADNLAIIEGNLVNHGSTMSTGPIIVKHGGRITNLCTMELHNDLNVEGLMANQSFLKVDDKLTIVGGAELLMYDGAISHVGSVLINGKVDGFGNTSMLKVEGRSDAYTTAQIKRNIYLCDLDGVENIPASVYRDGAKEECSLYIPVTACNPEGNGIITIVDTDNDGVADELDKYPNDPNKAEDFYYPNEDRYGALAFEDLWPAYGDYDFNDLVLDYRYHIVSNADNLVTEVNVTVVTKALGGSLHNGFGFQFNVPSSAVASVSGTKYFNNLINTNANGTEAGQSKATIIAFDDDQKLFPNNSAAFVNTVSANPHLNYDTTRIQISFSQPQRGEDLGIFPFNPFIFIDQNRGREVHLPANAPTDLADVSLFGTVDDNTNPSSGNTYKSKDNVPWALHLVKGYSYPEERVDLNAAYNYFSAWAQSGGQSFKDWYEAEPGYRNAIDFYQNQ